MIGTSNESDPESWQLERIRIEKGSNMKNADFHHDEKNLCLEVVHGWILSRDLSNSCVMRFMSQRRDAQFTCIGGWLTILHVLRCGTLEKGHVDHQEKDYSTLWCHQLHGWLENPRTDWRFF